MSLKPISLFIVSGGHGIGPDETFLPRKCKNATKNVRRRAYLSKQSLASSIFSDSCFVNILGIIYAIYTLSSNSPFKIEISLESKPLRMVFILATALYVVHYYVD